MDVPRSGPSRKTTRRRWYAGAGLLAVGAIALAVARPGGNSFSVERAGVLVDTVRRGEFVLRVRGAGILTPLEARTITALAPGRVERILVRPGDAVAADSVVLELVNPDLEHALRESESAVAQSQAELAAIRLQLKDQELDQRSRLSEAKSNYTSAKLQADAESDAAVRSAVSKLQAARSKVLAEQAADRVKVESERLDTMKASSDALLRAQLAKHEQVVKAHERQRELADSMRVRAGMAGTVQTVSVQIGQQLAEGALIARVAKPEPLVAELRIPEAEARDLKAGLPARVTLRDGSVAGEVARVDPAVERGSVRVQISLAGPLPASARPDLSIEGTIEIARTPDRVIVGRLPYGEPGAEVTVFRLDADGPTARRVPVRIGASSSRETEILAGLDPGDRIILSNPGEWTGRDEITLH